MYMANRDNLRSSFPIHITFLSFFCLIFPARFVSTKLNNSGKKGNPSLVPVSSRKIFKFYPFRMIVALGLAYVVFTILRNVPTLTNLFSV